MSVRNCHYSLRNSPKERSSYLRLATSHTPYPEILGPTVQTSVVWPSWQPVFLQPWGANNVSLNKNVQTEGTSIGCVRAVFAQIAET